MELLHILLIYILIRAFHWLAIPQLCYIIIDKAMLLLCDFPTFVF